MDPTRVSPGVTPSFLQGTKHNEDQRAGMKVGRRAVVVLFGSGFSQHAAVLPGCRNLRRTSVIERRIRRSRLSGAAVSATGAAACTPACGRPRRSRGGSLAWSRYAAATIAWRFARYDDFALLDGGVVDVLQRLRPAFTRPLRQLQLLSQACRFETR